MSETITSDQLDAIEHGLGRLHVALRKGLARSYCLRLWSEFVRARDGHRCVDCHSTSGLSAHHICRKSFIESAQFQTGNGITLCATCHREHHSGFNRRPDLSLPVDAEGGEKLEAMERLFSILVDDAVERELAIEAFYQLDENFLSTLKLMQGYAIDTHFPGAPIEQAYLILAEAEFAFRRALLRQEGLPVPDGPLLPGGLYLVHPAEANGTIRTTTIRTYEPRWPRPSAL